MPSNSWSNGWITGDIPTAAEFAKGVGAIYNTTLGSAAATIDITGIIDDYSALRILTYARGDTAATSATMAIRFNNDSSAIYNYEKQQANDATRVDAGTLNGTSGWAGVCPAASAPSNAFGSTEIVIPNYAGTTGYTTWKGESYLETADTAAGQVHNAFGGVVEEHGCSQPRDADHQRRQLCDRDARHRVRDGSVSRCRNTGG